MSAQAAARARRWTRKANDRLGRLRDVAAADPRPDWMPRKPLTAARAWRLERAAHRRFMRRSAARLALAPTDPGYRRAARLADEAYALAKSIRRVVWGPRA